MNKVNIKEIVYCNAKFKYNKKEYKLEKIVFKNKGDMMYYTYHILKPLKILIPVKLYDIEVLQRLGFENKNKGHHKAIKNDEQRNTITGAYE